MAFAEKVTSALIAARIGAGMAVRRVTAGPSLAERLAAIPTRGLPLARPATVHWDEYAIPFIEAETDEDAAVALGVAHAHLRLGQMEIMRRLATGRLAEMLGPAAVEMDRGLRILGFGRPVPAMLAAMPADTRRWVEAFAAGVSHYVRHVAALPAEFALLGLRRESWTAADILTIGRMASADCNWVILFNLLKLRRRPDWPTTWRALAGQEGATFHAGDHELAGGLGDLATRTARSGSNAVAVAGARSASGGALMAADPHLNLMLPNLWLAAGLRCPSYHMCGLMLPGLPFVAIGRNPQVAWSGTALQSASTDLFDAGGLPARPSGGGRIAVRWGMSRGAARRDTPLGPLLSDASILGLSDPVALKWMGHLPSDEMTAWLRLAQARDWAGFVAAADGIAVPGQHLLYADAAGHVGKLTVCRLPRRPSRPPADAVLPPAEVRHWTAFVTTRDLPQIYDPPGGIVVSANEKPRHAGVPIGLFFPGRDRFLRLHRLLRGRARLRLDDLAALQRDVQAEGAALTAAWLGRRLDDHPLAGRLARWDGAYRAEASEPLLFERLLCRLHGLAHGEDGESAYWASWNPAALTRRRLAALPPERLEAELRRAADEVLAEGRESWGDLHRLRLSHVLGMVPGLGRLFRFTDLPAAGGNETLMKTAHGLAPAGRHPVRYGANARFLADLADPDATRVVLLGGQDGWLGSENFLDQLAPWRDGRSIRLPLRLETVRATFSHRTVLLS